LKRNFSETKPEMMDQPDADPEMLKDDLRNLRIINRYFGGLSALRKAVVPIAMKTKLAEVTTILDLATGSGDQPVSLVQAFRRLGKRVQITAVDRNEIMLNAARQYASDFPEIQFELGDILDLPYASESFDFVSCSLAIHHLSRSNGVKLLREMNRICRLGFVVNDLSRSYIGAATAWVYTHLTTTNPMTRYDSVASVLRAFTRGELTEMTDEAEVQPVRIFTTPLFRLVVVKEK
jgi:ubiquinone/menaquinone biosynthesis C-methylase UbiE